MKKLMIVVIAVTLLTTAQAQKISADKVPSAVSAAFKTKFPKAEKVTWEMENPKEYEANFKVNSAEQSAVFDAVGNWMVTETEIKVAELPKAVSQTLSKKFSGYKIKEAEKVEKKGTGNCFEAEIEKEGKTLEVVLSPTGEVLDKKEKQKDKKD